MAEIVGLVASVLQLVDTVARARSYLHDFRNAPTEQQQLLQEIKSLEPVLVVLDERFSDSENQIVGGEHFREVLFQLRVVMEGLTKKLDMDGLSSRLTWPLWGKEDVQQGLSTIERFKGMVGIWLAIDNRNSLRGKHIHKAEEVIILISADLFKNIRDIKRNQEDDHDDTRREKILDWYSPLNFFQRQEEILKTRQRDSGGWFLADKSFKRWKAAEGKILWCCGMPGAGKTVLTSIAVDDLRISSKDLNVGVAAIYLNYKEIHSHTLPNLLAGLWRQLVVGRLIPSTLEKLYKHHRELRTRPSLDEDHAILCSTISEYSRVFIFVDALDEYPEDERDSLLLYLSRLEPSVNLMLTSRPHIAIRHLIPTFTIEICANEDDIRRYVRAQTQKPRLFRHIEKEPALMDAIEEKIVRHSDGMFLLAKLHIDSLTHKNTVTAVRVALEDMQSTLNGTYDEAMERINQQSEDDRHLARRTLSWVLNAKRPLNISELREALSTEPGATYIDPDNMLDMHFIPSVCAGLVVVDEKSHLVRLIHHTTHIYLDRIQLTILPGAQTEIASTCITYLSLRLYSVESDKESNIHRNMAQNYRSLLDYAVQHCLTHVRGEPESRIRQPLLTFLANGSKWRPLWNRTSSDPAILRNVPETAPALWLSAAFHLEETCRHLIKENLTGNVLQEAAFRGQGLIVRRLIEAGADATPQDSNRGTALQLASSKGEVEIVRMLIEAGADVNAPAGVRGTALQVASVQGHTVVVRTLLDAGADTNSRVEPYETALRAAALGGHTDIASLLIGNGAEINPGGRHGTALATALCCGHDGVARVLIAHGANVNDPGAYGWTSLGIVSGNGNSAIVHLLLQKGADPNSTSERNNTPLQAAALGGHETIVQTLIKAGANVNADGGDHGTALQIACRLGWQDVIQTLMENGAEPRLEAGKPSPRRSRYLGPYIAPMTDTHLPYQYRIGRTLRSEMDFIVKEAVQIQNGKSYACKIISKNLKEGQQRMVQNEIAALKRISGGHPNSVTLHDYFETSNNVYLCFDLCTGGELLDRICSKGGYHEAAAADLVRTIVAAVADIHGAGIVHGDLSAENFFFNTSSDEADIIITDFGFSRIVDSEGEKFNISTEVYGTLDYMAPEIFLKTGHGKPVDVWALGVLSYFILAGYTPFDGATPEDEIEAIIVGDYKFEPKEFWKNISNDACNFIRACLDMNPEHRPTARQALEHKWLASTFNAV
ncbi:hypothetical protein C8J57DRAFT_1537494 [Mycena rebaudengoi]|nr:hypothetical protein C8J57DRAFT_1537494 [Mycena rebaudengoi]